MSKILVTYFSASGVTENVAKSIAKVVDGELFEICPKERYTNADLNWMDKSSRTTEEKNNPSFRPEIAIKLDNLKDYEYIFVGFPIWWYKAPNIIYSFLDSYDFSGKKIIPFCTSGGSGIEDSARYLQQDYKNYTFLKGKRFTSRVTVEEIKELLK